jgi:hypothetical protein
VALSNPNQKQMSVGWQTPLLARRPVMRSPTTVRVGLPGWRRAGISKEADQRVETDRSGNRRSDRIPIGMHPSLCGPEGE